MAAVMVPTAFAPARCASQNSALPLTLAVDPSRAIDNSSLSG